MTGSERILVAGIGNIFLGDDAFGVHVARLLMGRNLPPGVRVVDFGIRGLDLAYALSDGCEAAILVDATPRRQAPGTIYVIEPETSDEPPADLIDAHTMDPLKVLRLARSMGANPNRILIVGCESAPLGPELDVIGELSPSVAAAIEPAADMVESLITQLLSQPSTLEASCT